MSAVDSRSSTTSPPPPPPTSGAAGEPTIGTTNNDGDVDAVAPQDDMPYGVEEEQLMIRIVSAFYGPCETLRGNGRSSNDVDNDTISYTRDVGPHVRALLLAQERQQQQQARNDDSNHHHCRPYHNDNSINDLDDDDPHVVRMNALVGGGMKRTSIPLLALHKESSSSGRMNVLFGDPCPGVTKQLQLHYVIMIASSCHRRKAASAEVHHVTFAEHEPVLLRRNMTFCQDETSSLQRATQRAVVKQHQAQSMIRDANANQHDSAADPTTTTTRWWKKDATNDLNRGTMGVCPIPDDEDDKTLQMALRLGRTQSIDDFAKASLLDLDQLPPPSSERPRAAVESSKTLAARPSSHAQHESASMGNDIRSTMTTETTKTTVRSHPRLRSATSEIIVPLVLTFLPIKERVTCRLVCRLWRNIVRDWGVAPIIDWTAFPTHTGTITRPFLRGLLSHSFSSLHTLRLAGMEHLEKSDLHPSIPHLRKLRTLDVSHCTQLDDSTLVLLAQHLSQTLEVLYIKGLHSASDDGVVAICQSCARLKVLEVSYIPITDVSGNAMGRHLTQLRALYMRENYQLTNVDAITANCTKLQQLTLWGCLKLKHLTFDSSDSTAGQESPSGMIMTTTTSRSLVSLNLWGCHSLRDDIAKTLACMTNLRSLIVSECHRLTDAFAFGLAHHVPQLVHLHLRYCKRLSDEGVNVIANSMHNLYSLDLSFCSKVTILSISNLLETRYDTLSELRLCNCHQLEIVRNPHEDTLGVPPGQRNLNNHRRGRAGQSILISLNRPARIHGPGHESYLSLLDLRNCGGQVNPTIGYPDYDPFVHGMKSLEFEQKIPGFFVRPARWNAAVQERLVNRLQEYMLLEP